MGALAAEAHVMPRLPISAQSIFSRLLARPLTLASRVHDDTITPALGRCQLSFRCSGIADCAQFFRSKWSTNIWWLIHILTSGGTDFHDSEQETFTSRCRHRRTQLWFPKRALCGVGHAMRRLSGYAGRWRLGSLVPRSGRSIQGGQSALRLDGWYLRLGA